MENCNSYNIIKTVNGDKYVELRGATLVDAENGLERLRDHYRDKVKRETVFSGDTLRIRSCLGGFGELFGNPEILPEEFYEIVGSKDPLLPRGEGAFYGCTA